MLINDFKALHLKGSEQVKITLANGKIIIGLLLNDYLTLEKILIYNFGADDTKPEEYINLDIIRELKII